MPSFLTHESGPFPVMGTYNSPTCILDVPSEDGDWQVIPVPLAQGYTAIYQAGCGGVGGSAGVGGAQEVGDKPHSTAGATIQGGHSPGVPG